MRKTLFSITLLIIAALAVTACTATPVAPTAGVPSNGTASVPQTGSTPVRTSIGNASGNATGSATAAVTLETTVTPTGPAATTPATAATTAAPVVVTMSPTSAATAVPTTMPLATQTSTSGGTVIGTPQAGIPEQFVRLSILLQSNLITGTESGQVTGVVIAQPQPQTNGATPTAAPGVKVGMPYIRYIVVNTSSPSGEMLLPWQMFAFEPVVSMGNKISQNFTLKGAAASRNNAPRISLPADTGVLATGFDNQVLQYWASQGFAIPVTGASDQEPGTQVLLRKTFQSTNIVGNNSQALGQLAEILIDPASGQFKYVVFNGGQLFGNRMFIVPVENLNFQLDSATATNLGNILLNINITPDMLKGAPVISGLKLIPFDQNTLQQWNNFWQSLQNSTK